MLTGTLTSMTREQATEALEAPRREGVGIGEQEDQLPRRRRRTPAASSKKAQKLGVEVLIEEQFRDLIMGRQA